MCALYDHDKLHNIFLVSLSSVGVRPLPKYSTTDVRKSLGITIKSIGSWFKILETNYVWICKEYEENMNKLFQKISTNKPKLSPGDFKKKRKLFLSEIGGKWYVYCLQNPPPTEKISFKQEIERGRG